MSEFAQGILFGISGVIGLAIIAVLVSQKSQTSGVIQSAAAGLSQIIGAAVSPVTGAATTTGGTTASNVLSSIGLSNSTGNTYSI